MKHKVKKGVFITIAVICVVLGAIGIAVSVHISMLGKYGIKNNSLLQTKYFGAPEKHFSFCTIQKKTISLLSPYWDKQI
jgi:hypothetical protein